ncbi:MAG: DUF389 domain-containing protein [Bacteroidales bacterium]|nr:DUF389 domain-containing protein [Bacteroidales bacterium]
MNFKTVTYKFLKDRFNLEKNKEEYGEVIDAITRNIYFRGTNLWVLMFAIIIASVGLNVNSTAVIIGAMLVSPLMGPIMGIGLGAGINDFRLMRLSAYNFLVAIVISLISSTLYFLLSPLNEAHSELLSRTTPTVYDVIIALFGGFAGIVATSSKEKGTVIPGVAIATALMPPLCTAGYGLAVGNMFFFMGAIYLFFINSVFICLATFLIVRYLHFPRHEYRDESTGHRMKLWIWLIVIITFVPSVVIAYFMIRRNVFETNASQFISRELIFEGSTIIEKKIDAATATIKVVYIGKGISPDFLENAKKKLGDYHLQNANLKVTQGMKELTTSDITNMKSQIIEDLYKRNQETLMSKDEKIDLLEKELTKYQSGYLSGTMLNEIRALFPEVEEVSFTKALLSSTKSKIPDTVDLVYLKFSKNMRKSELQRLESWLNLRVGGDKVKIVIGK